MQNKKSIEEFISFFDEQINEIGDLNNPLFKKIAIISLMDALSRVWANGKTQQSHRKRFISLITECIRWEHSKRVSITQTYYQIMESRPFSNRIMENEISNLFNRMQASGRIYRIEEIDPFLRDIEYIAKSNDDKKLLLKSTHAELIYTYRNALIHEFRQHGYGMESLSDNKETPFYHRMTDLDSQKTGWELVYPAKFLLNLGIEGLIRINEFLLKEDINPYSFFKFGSPWKD